MKKTDALINSLIYSAYLFASFICGVAVDFLALRILNSFIVLSSFNICVIRAAIYLCVSFGVLSVLAFKEGYREARCSFSELLLSFVPTLVIHLIFAIIFRFNVFFAGGAKYVTALFLYRTSLTSISQISEIRYRILIPTLIFIALLYFADITVLKKIGASKRIKDRESMMSEHDAT